MIPTNFGVNVATPEPLKVTLDVSERTMLLATFVALVGAAVLRKMKR